MKKFVYLTVVFCVAFASFNVCLNYIVDPFNIFHSKFLKYQFQMNERFMKIEFLQKNNNDFNSYLIGSSRIGTTNPAVINKYIPNSKFYNFTISSATISDELRHIQYMINANYKISNLYIQVDVIDNMQTYLQEKSDYLRMPHPYVAGKSLSQYYIDYLFNFFPFNTKGKILKNFEGSNDAEYDIKTGVWSRPSKDLRVEADCSQYIKSEPEFNTHIKPSMQNKATDKNMKSLELLVDICKKNKISLIVFVTPHNHNYLDNVYESEYYVFLKKLSAVTNYWDFSGYNSVTTNDCNYYESSHYRSKIGNLIAARIFDDKNISVPRDFGVYVTRQDVESHITNLREERAKWRATHSTDVAEIEALKTKQSK